MWICEDGVSNVVYSDEPTEEEVMRHVTMGHPHFRSWCPSCVRGRGKSGVHKKGKDEEFGEGRKGKEMELGKGMKRRKGRKEKGKG